MLKRDVLWTSMPTVSSVKPLTVPIGPEKSTFHPGPHPSMTTYGDFTVWVAIVWFQ
jgi:hypothetical protein